MIMYWILFRRETDNVHYFWNGLWPICVYTPVSAGPLEKNVWPDHPTAYENTVTVLKATMGKSVRVLKFIGDKRKYIVVSKGEFPKE